MAPLWALTPPRELKLPSSGRLPSHDRCGGDYLPGTKYTVWMTFEEPHSELPVAGALHLPWVTQAGCLVSSPGSATHLLCGR